MKVMTKILTVGLIIGAVAHLWVTVARAAEVALDTPISSIELDAEGNVARILFSTGEELSSDDLYLKADEVKGREIGGIRRLPVQVVKDPDSGKIEVIVPFSEGATSVIMPPGAEVTLSTVSNLYACPFPCRMKGGNCDCPWDLEAAFRFPALVEVDSEIKMLELPAD